MNSKQMLMSSSYLILPIEMLQKLGIYPTIILSELATRELFYIQNGTIGQDGYFYMTSKDMEKATTLSRFKQDEGLKILLDNGLIAQEVRGLPGVRYFKLLDSAIDSYFANFQQTTLRKEDLSDCKKLTTSKSIDIESNIIDNDLLIVANNSQTKDSVFDVMIDKSKETTFENSLAYDPAVWNHLLRKEIELGVDVMFYKQAVDDWNNTLRANDKKKKRTAKGWVATARTFMRKDNERGKMKMTGANNDRTEEQMKYFLSL